MLASSPLRLRLLARCACKRLAISRRQSSCDMDSSVEGAKDCPTAMRRGVYSGGMEAASPAALEKTSPGVTRLQLQWLPHCGQSIDGFWRPERAAQWEVSLSLCLPGTPNANVVP